MNGSIELKILRLSGFKSLLIDQTEEKICEKKGLS